MAELQARMSSREFAEWAAFDQVEPLGDRRGDVQAAVVASTIGNAYRDRKKRRKAFQVSDFMPLAGVWDDGRWTADDGPADRGRRTTDEMAPLSDAKKRALWARFRGWAK